MKFAIKPAQAQLRTPLYRTRKVKSKKGKGSYTRKNQNKNND